jgi:hypothetical protein
MRHTADQHPCQRLAGTRHPRFHRRRARGQATPPCSRSHRGCVLTVCQPWPGFDRTTLHRLTHRRAGPGFLGPRWTAWSLLVMNRSLVRGSPGAQFAGPRSTAAKYSNASDFDRTSLPSNAQIRAQTRLDDHHAPSSQRGGQGFESPQLHRYNRRPKVLSRSGMRAFAVSGAKVQQQSTAVAGWNALMQPLPLGRQSVGRHRAISSSSLERRTQQLRFNDRPATTRLA